jgi:PAS domain S-box-containing protein
MALDELSREDLVVALQDAQARLELAKSDADTERLLHDLQVHQIELETQNRELRESHAKVEESRSRFADLYDFAPVAYCTVDVDGKVKEANLTATAYFGVDRSAITGRPLANFAQLEDRAALRAHLKRCANEKARVSAEVRFTVPSLGAVPFQLVSTPLLGEAELVQGCKIGLTDISALKRSEERLRLLADASARLAESFDIDVTFAAVVRSLVPAVADLCFVDVFEDGGTARRVEVAVADPGKTPVAEALKRPPTPRAELSEATMLNDAAGTALSSAIGDSSDREAVLTACGARAVMMVPMKVRGRVVGVLGFVQAESARRYAQADLAFAQDLAHRGAMAIEAGAAFRAAERAQKARQDMLSIVSHELQNPLTGVRLSADLLLEAPPPPPGERPDGRRHLERIHRGAVAMKNLIDDLHELTGLDSGRLSVDLQPNEAGQMIEEAVDLLAPVAAKRRLGLEAVRGERLAVICDRKRMLQVLSNLIGNALKFTPEGGQVTVSATEAKGSDPAIVFCVKDDGPGIPKQVMHHLFQRSFQAKDGAGDGRGLGLFIARGIVEAMRGTIWVESAPKKGTAFFFTLPACEVAKVGKVSGEVEQVERERVSVRVKAPAEAMDEAEG